MKFEEIKRRNFPGRTFDLTQENARQLQVDVEYLLELITNAEYIHKPSREDKYAHTIYSYKETESATSYRAVPAETILALIERLESAETYLCAISSGNECSACSCTCHGVPDKHFEKYKPQDEVKV